MPIYEYHCPKCKEKTEVLAIRDRKVYCICGGEMKRLVSVPAFRIYTK